MGGGGEATSKRQDLLYLFLFHGLTHGRMNYKDSEPYMSAFLKNWPVNGICGIVFNRFYRLEKHSLILVGIFDPACELLPPWTKELYSCTVAPLSSLSLTPTPSQTKCTVYTDSVCLRGGGDLCCRPYSAGILHSASDQIQKLPNCFTTPNKMTGEDDI